MGTAMVTTTPQPTQTLAPGNASSTTKNDIVPAQSYVFPDAAAINLDLIDGNDIKDLSPAEHQYFVNGLRQIKAQNPSEYQTFCEAAAAFKSNVGQMHEAQYSLIMGHYEAGQHLVELRMWFMEHFPRKKGWTRFLIDQLGIDCTIRTCQRAIRFYKYWNSYEDTLKSLARTEPALEGLMMFSQSNTSEVAQALSIEYFRVQLTTQIGEDGSTPSINAQRLTVDMAKRIKASGNAIDALPEKVQPIVTDIVQRYNAFNPDMIAEMGDLTTAALEEIAETGTINIRQMVGEDRDEMTSPIPIAQAGATDVRMLKGDVTEQRRYEVSQKIQQKQSARDAEQGITVDGRLKPMLVRFGEEGWAQAIEEYMLTNNIGVGTLIRLNIEYLQEKPVIYSDSDSDEGDDN